MSHKVNESFEMREEPYTGVRRIPAYVIEQVSPNCNNTTHFSLSSTMPELLLKGLL